jgi:hypothetical protein
VSKPDLSTGEILGIEWEEPPPTVRDLMDQKRIEAIVELLRKHPQRWAKIDTYSTRGKASSRGGAYAKRFPDMEFTSRRVKDSSVLYARCTRTVGQP